MKNLPINQIIQGDCLGILKDIDDNSIESVVTDPPYGLEFMDKKWDYDVPSVEIWQEVKRVMKPGAWLLSFAGTRTYHRMTVNIEDAGFEIRDMIAWVYGSGFPKSHNIGKAVDKLQGNEREVVSKKPGTYADIRGEQHLHGDDIVKDRPRLEVYNTKGNSEWEGWGTALKPALEPIVVAMKPREGTFAENVLKWGVGGINIDGSRVGTIGGTEKGSKPTGKSKGIYGEGLHGNVKINELNKGRFPANFIHDGSEEVRECFPDTTSRFFYCAKASKSERNKGLEEISNGHPTVKPVDLMRYLVKLVTPPEGTVLDPFIGSGTTAIACKLEGFNYIGIEKEEEYVKIAKARVEAYKYQPKLL